MTRARDRRFSILHLLFLAGPVFAACSGSGEPTGPGGGGSGGEIQTASAIPTPSSGSIIRGSTTTSVTVVYEATGGLVITSFGIQRQYGGISVTQTSTQTSGTRTTRAYTIGADGTVPLGDHVVRFSAPITGYTGTGAVPTAVANFTLTVNP